MEYFAIFIAALLVPGHCILIDNQTHAADGEYREEKQLQLFSAIKFVVNGKRSVCYHDFDVGCFDMRDAANYKMAHTGVLPEDPGFIDLGFELFNSQHPTGVRFSYSDDPSTQGFVAAQPVRLIIHGMNGASDHHLMLPIRHAFLDKLPENNVLMVDWKKGAATDHVTRVYAQSAANTEIVGRLVGNYLIRIHESVGIPYIDMHLIGLSFGAQVGGFAGSWLQQKLQSGLDPAFPLFGERTYTDLEMRSWSLDTGDATFVDIVHTNMGNDHVLNSMGQKAALGHVDFIVNGGHDQPGCPKVFIGYMEELFKPSELSRHACSHERSIFIYTESITAYPNCKMTTKAGCGSWKDYLKGNCFLDSGNRADPTSVLGLYSVNHGGRGVHYVKTLSVPFGTLSGFCGFYYLLQMETASNQLLNIVELNGSDIEPQHLTPVDIPSVAQKTQTSDTRFNSDFGSRNPNDSISRFASSQTYQGVIIAKDKVVTSLTVKMKGSTVLQPDSAKKLNSILYHRGSNVIQSAVLLDRSGAVQYQTCGPTNVDIFSAVTLEFRSSC